MAEQQAEMAKKRIEISKQQAEMAEQQIKELTNQNLILKKNIKAGRLKSSNLKEFKDTEDKSFETCDQIYSKFSWQGPNSVCIQSAWDSLRALEDIPSDGSSITDLRDIFLGIFSDLKEKLNLSADAKLFHEVSMPYDGVYFDFVLSNGNLREVCYPDASAIIAIKTSSKDKTEGEMQACCGLVDSVMSSSWESSSINMVSLFFDFESVKVYYFEDQYLQAAYRSNDCPCFPANWKTLETPTLGFQILCHVFSVPINGLHEIELENGTKIKCDATIISRNEYAVYAINKDQLPDNIPRDREYVAKVLTKKDGEFEAFMRRELKTNQTIYEFENFREYSVFYPDLKIKDGFAMVRGTPLVVATKAAKKISELALFDLLKKISIQSFTALFNLNSNSWNHRDIRPNNIVLDDHNNAKLIDFNSADILECIIRYRIMYGQRDPFWADQKVKYMDRPHLYMPRWDYESLVYSILCCALGSEENDNVFKTFDTRREFLRTCEKSPRSILRFCALFFSSIQCLGPDVPEQEFKDSVLSALNEFAYNENQ